MSLSPTTTSLSIVLGLCAREEGVGGGGERQGKEERDSREIGEGEGDG